MGDSSTKRSMGFPGPDSHHWRWRDKSDKGSGDLPVFSVCFVSSSFFSPRFCRVFFVCVGRLLYWGSIWLMDSIYLSRKKKKEEHGGNIRYKFSPLVLENIGICMRERVRYQYAMKRYQINVKNHWACQDESCKGIIKNGRREVYWG